MNSAAIQIENLRKSFGETVAVDGLSLVVNPGEIFGLIGPDGAGKTTTMRIACGLLVPDSGRALVMGRDSTLETAQVKDHLGYMPQRFSLYPDLTVAENLRFFADMFHIPASERQTKEERLMHFSRLAPFRNRRASQLSGGMKQKLALSCMLIHSPDVLILDEPTTGVDPISRQEFWQILKDLSREGRALLVSTPYMDEAQLCDRVALMHSGKSITQGTPDVVTSRFPRRVLEVHGPDLRKARALLLELEHAGIAVNRFGDRLHIVYDSDEQAQQVASRLKDHDVSLMPIEPTIEDTFVELMGKGHEPA